MELAIKRLTDPAALYRHYQGQDQPQPCHILLDLEDGELTCDYDPEISGGQTPAVWHGRTQTWPIPRLTAEAANNLMERIAPLAQRILDGSSIEWDGNNHVGRLNADAQDASDALESVAADWGVDSDLVTAWDAFDWYAEGDDPAPGLGLTADTTDVELDAIEKRAEADIHAEAEGVVVVENLDRYLASRRDEMREQLREELEQVAEQHAALRERRDSLVRRIAGWGVPADSDRALGALAGKSHTWVRGIRTTVPAATAEYGILTDYTTGENIRPATTDEHARSLAAGETGAFDLDGRAVFVAGGPEKPTSSEVNA